MHRMWFIVYSDIQKTKEQEDDIILKYLSILDVFLESKKFTRHLLIRMGLFTMHSCCVSWLLDFLNL